MLKNKNFKVLSFVVLVAALGFPVFAGESAPRLIEKTEITQRVDELVVINRSLVEEYQFYFT